MSTFVNPLDSPDGVLTPSIGGGVLESLTGVNLPVGDTWFPSAPGSGDAWFVGSAPSVYLSMQLVSAVSTVFFTVEYYPTPGSNVPIGNQIYAKSTLAGTLDIVPVLGPFARLRVTNNALVSTTANIVVAQLGAGGYGGLGATNTGVGGRILANYGAIVGAGATVTQPMNANVPGPASLFILNGAAAVAAALVQVVAGPAVNTYVAAVSTQATNGSADHAMIALPNDDWQLRIENFGGAGQMIDVAVVSAR